MAQVLGKRSAELLVSLGLPRSEVVEALKREIGLNHEQADRAWWATAPSYQAVHSGRFSRV
jgi:hypothetical protein